MIRIAIVEDEQLFREKILRYLHRYEEKNKQSFSIKTFENGMQFLTDYRPEYDIIFMDIMMPMLNGMDAAHLLREKDGKVMLIFVTSMQQYAIQGYSVSATDFIVKPVSYPQFKLKFTRFLTKLRATQAQKEPDILLKTGSGFVRLHPHQIVYVEVRAHHCIYHTDMGEYRIYQTMKSVAEQLEPCGFAKCNNYLLVNLARVTGISEMTVQLGKETLPMSHPRKNAFTSQFLAFSESQKK